jgi:murein DD-endopeptidase MepM/ murein hydrolase activator NlpD
MLNPSHQPEAKLELRLEPAHDVYAWRAAWSDLLGERCHYDMVIHAVALQNSSAGVVSVEEISIEGTALGRLLQRTVYGHEEITERAGAVVAKDRLGLRRLLDLMLWPSRPLPPGLKLAEGTRIKPGELLVFPNIYLMFNRRPDTLKIAAHTLADGKKSEISSSLKVTEYVNGVKYAMPLEGTWLMKGTPDAGVLDHHRFGTASEFGADFLRLGPEAEIFKNDGEKDDEFFSYGERVLAAAGGRVAAVNGAESQERSRFHPKPGEAAEQFQARQLRETQQALHGDVSKWAAGNYVLIEHAKNEYSAYLHLKTDSIKVRAGDMVRQGQHIADVGNTGDSFGAHLHFQVIDRPDLVRCRSLPFSFDNMGLSLSEPGWLARAVRG